MQRFRNVTFRLLLLLLIMCGSVTSCGTEEAVSENTTELIVQYQQLKYQYTQLAYQLETEQAVYNSAINQLQQSNESLLNQALQHRQKYESLISGMSEAEKQSAVEALQSAETSSELVAMKKEVAKAERDLEVLNELYQEVLVMLVACKPRDFASISELEAWRMEQKDFGDNTIANCRAMQRVAWASGYILSVRTGTQDCIAFVGGGIYKIIPAYDVEAEGEEDFVCLWKIG